MTEFKVKFGRDGDFPTSVVAYGASNEDPRRLTELANTMAARAAMSRIGQRLFGHSLASVTKDGLMRCGQSWWEHTYKGGSTDVEASHRYVEFAEAQGEPFNTIVTCAPDCLIYLGAARWADQGFPTLTMGERLAAALCGTEVPEEMYDEIKAPWGAFVIEIPSGLFTVFDPEHQLRTRATRILVHHVEDSQGEQWWWMLFSEKDQHFWREGTVRQVLHPVEFREKETEKYRLHGGEAFAEHVNKDQRLYHIVSRLVFNSILTLTDPDRIRPVGSSHKRYAARGERPTGSTPEQRVFIIGKPIDLDCRQQLRDYLEGHSRRSFKVTTQFLVRGYWRQQPYGPKNALRRRQWILPHWKGPEDGVIPVRDHDLGEEPSDP